MQYVWGYVSPLGEMTMASDGKALIGLWFNGQKYFARTLGEHIEKDLPIFEDTRRWLDAYFSGQQPSFTPALAPEGSAFRKRVWQSLLRIPYGQTVTYGDIAREIAHERGAEQMSAQAVGGAVGHNPISLIIPCHRVVGSDGSLTGYAGGTDKKRALLLLEQSHKST